jgi:hypothetical protein
VTGGPSELIPPELMLGSSDWDDEDLLTVGEASERLLEEARMSQERIRQHEDLLTAGNTSAEVGDVRGALAAERRRLEDLLRAATRIKAAQANAPTGL